MAKRGRPKVPKDLLAHDCIRLRFGATSIYERWDSSITSEAGTGLNGTSPNRMVLPERVFPIKGICMHTDTNKYNSALVPADRNIAQLLAEAIDRHLPEAENKVWHAHPVWFIDGNPVVGYSKLKGCVRLLFWSGQSFEEAGLKPEGSFKAAEARYTAVDQVDAQKLQRWLAEARDVQWDYKNIVRRKGRLDRLK